MPKKQKVSLINRAVTAVRDNPITSGITLFAFLSALGGVVTQSDNIASAGAWVIPSPVAYVRSHVKFAQSETLKAVRDSQIEQAEGKRDASKRAVNDLELRAIRATTAEEKLKIEQAIRDERDTLDALKSQIKTLNAIRNQ